MKNYNKKKIKNNKEILLKKENRKKNKVICKLCKKEREISRCQYNLIIRKKDINDNICRPCQALLNLPIK